jgi:hypothetical protein
MWRAISLFCQTIRFCREV